MFDRVDNNQTDPPPELTGNNHDILHQCTSNLGCNRRKFLRYRRIFRQDPITKKNFQTTIK